MKKATAAIVILGIIAIIAYKQWQSHKLGPAGSALELKGAVGGEKMALMEDPQIVEILKSRYQVWPRPEKSGSIEMVRRPPGDRTFLFPGSQLATEIFKTNPGAKAAESQTVLRSPVVIYSWDHTAQALIKEGIVQQINNAYYIVDLPKLVKLIVSGRTWAELGLPYYGKILVTTTDPSYSNSGMMFAGLMANMLVGNNEVADERNIEPHLATIRTFFARLGFMERSSSDLFEAYLTTGEGAKPLVVGYENQMIEYALQKPALWNQSKDKVRVLYPMPTCWSSHELIALNESSRALIRALLDEEVQKLAWERHGFRSGSSGVVTAPQILSGVTVPENLDQIVPLPNYRTMEKILGTLQQ
ncbi:MAG TPA: hypothetical protein VJ302_14500 [Blastocatellia bacterium]|nr:hypothetical protein [Blastocatellia bacterium]